MQARLTRTHLVSSAPSSYPHGCVVWPQLLSLQGLLQMKTAKDKLPPGSGCACLGLERRLSFLGTLSVLSPVCSLPAVCSYPSSPLTVLPRACFSASLSLMFLAQS